MQPFRTFRKWQYPDVIPSVTKLLVVPLNEVANQRQEARHRLILVDEAVHIPHGFRWLPRVQDDRHIALDFLRSEEHTSELQSHLNLVCRLLLEKKKTAFADGEVHLLFENHQRDELDR